MYIYLWLYRDASKHVSNYSVIEVGIKNLKIMTKGAIAYQLASTLITGKMSSQRIQLVQYTCI